MKIEVISHYVKEGTMPDGTPRGNKVKQNPIYISFLVTIKTFNGTDVKLVINGCRLSDGILRPPSMSGRYAGNWFPYLFFPYGVDNAMADQLYSLVQQVAEDYGRLSEVATKEQCLAGWLTTPKALANYKNLTIDLQDIVTREK